ncbi:IST1-like protein [Porphyridium purpureum]|uniref:IST1-like protein n=1 Tax=Porphyridium purpureum TaxID=35688 RepID=A0A5J4YVF9_PORPP|nr:IST1-like protein [Porphyridium purpureum]|eukprot:POR2725..scf227_4
MGLFKKDKKEAGSGGAGAAAGGRAPNAAPFDSVKFKIQIKSAINRAQIVKTKAENARLANEREIAQLLGQQKGALARVKTESMLRDIKQSEALDVLLVFCEMVLQRLPLIQSSQNLAALPPDCLESVCTMVYASGRCGIPELTDATNQLRLIYGPQTIDELAAGAGPNAVHINKRLKAKLDAGLPEGRIVLEHMKRITKEQGVAWVPPPEFEDLDNASAFHVTTPSYNPTPQGAGQSFHNIPGGYGATGGPPQQQHQYVPGMQHEPGMYQPGGMGQVYPTGGNYQAASGGYGAPPPSSGYGMPVTDGFGAQGYTMPGGSAKEPEFGNPYGMPPGASQAPNPYGAAPPYPTGFNPSGGQAPTAPPGATEDDDYMDRINQVRR